MRKIYFGLWAFCLSIASAYGQTLVNNGATIFINTNGKLHISGSLTNGTGSSLTNKGILEVNGNTTNNGSLSAPAGSTIVYQGTMPLVLSGTQPVTGQDVVINNPAGLTLNTPLQVSGVFTFTNGIVDATSHPVIFTESATVNGPSNVSHVNGTVVREGIGSFTYPVGDGTNYQKVVFNATANASGIGVRYHGANAGLGNYTTAGSEAIALEKHSTGEYWDIVPNSTATGRVTLFWDGVADVDGTVLIQRRVAHLKNGDWLNEGGSAIGSLSNGSITSNVISTFSPFTIGAIPTTLPVRLDGFSAKLDGNRVKLEWTTASELDNSHFLIGRSTNGKDYVRVARVNGKGTTTASSNYLAYDHQPAVGLNYYRLLQVDHNGKETELAIKSLDFSLSGLVLSAYPNPTSTHYHIVSNVATAASITAITGQEVKRLQLVPGINQLDASTWPVGIYILKTSKGILKLVKQ